MAVDYDLFAGQRSDVDMDQPLAIGQIEPAMREALSLHAGVEAQPFHQSDGNLFEYARADARQYMGSRVSLQHNARDAFCMKQMAKQQTGRAATDNADLRFDDASPSSEISL